MAHRLTLMDKLGKAISRYLYRRYMRSPGRPGASMYSGEVRFMRFNRRWPWSWHG